MKHIWIASLIVFILVFVPGAVTFAQDGDTPADTAPEPESGPALGQITPEAAEDNFQDAGMWFFSLVVLLAGWGGIVSLVLVDKGIKPVMSGILALIPNDANSILDDAARIFIIHGAIAAASLYAVWEKDLNIFLTAPEQVVGMVPSHDFQLVITAGALALFIFLAHWLKGAGSTPEPDAATLALRAQ